MGFNSGFKGLRAAGRGSDVTISRIVGGVAKTLMDLRVRGPPG